MAATPFSPLISFGAPSQFVPRPYPPPCLEGVPRSFHIESLRGLASSLFNNHVGADCCVVIPFEPLSEDIPRDPNIVERPLKSCFHPVNERRRPLAYSHRGMLGIMHLHVDYLSPFSRLFRALFAGMTPRDYIAARSKDARVPPDISAYEGRVPQLWAGFSPQHALVYLPLPDPRSFPYIAHWMYHGDTHAIVKALCAGRFTWQGLAANGAALGMSEEFHTMLREVRAFWAVRRAEKPDDWSESDETDDEDLDDDDNVSMSDVSSNADAGGDVSDLANDEDDDQADDEDEELGYRSAPPSR